MTTYVLALSIIVQGAAAVMAFRLIGITGRRAAWGLIAVALALMAVRRLVPLCRLVMGDSSLPPDPLNECIGLALSVVMAAGIARIAPLFMERKFAEEILNRLNRELRAVSSCNQVLMRSEDEQALLNDICNIVCDEAGYRMAWVGYAQNDEAKTIRPVASAGVEIGYLEHAGLTWLDSEEGSGPCGTAIRSGEIVCIQDFNTGPQAAPWRDRALKCGYRSGITLPLRDENANTFGIINIYSEEPNAFTSGEMRLLEELSGDLAYGIVVLRNRMERKRAEESLRERERHSQSLLRLSRSLEQSHTYAEVLNATRYEVNATIGYKNLWAYLLSEDRKTAKALAAGGPMSDIVMSEDGTAMLTIEGDRMLEEIAAAKEIVIVADAQTDERVNREIVSRMGNRTIVNVPIILFDRHLGSVGMGTFGEEGVRIPSSSEQEYLVALASHMAVTLDRIHLLTQRKRAVEDLCRLNEELEQRVRDRTFELELKNRELERLNRIFVGRELRMMELKKQIQDVGTETGNEKTDAHVDRSLGQ